MNHLLSLLILFLLLQQSNAQSLQVQGIVVNEADKKPIADASVFINNGSKGTVTDSEGRFVLTGISSNNFELVVSHVTYETIVIDINPTNIGKRFRVQMTARQNELDEVIIEPIIKDGWKRWGKLFVENFIGTSANAQKCVLQNPDALIFRYNKKSGTLRVTAREQLKIRNNALGYNIKYQLEQFEFDHSKGAVSSLGYINYEDLEAGRTKTNRWKKARQAAYEGSIMHFMRSFFQNSLVKDGFDIRQLIRINKKDTSKRTYYDRIMKYDYSEVDTTNFFVNILKSSAFSDPVIHLTGKQLLRADSIRYYDSAHQQTLMYFNNDVQVVYKNELESSEYLFLTRQVRKPGPQSSIFYFRTGTPVVVQANGLFFEPLNVFNEGYWAFEKLAELLPSDYEVE